MNTHLKTLAEQALKLQPDEREALVQLLIVSVDNEAGIETAWAVEVARRAAELEHGASQALPVADALAHIHSNLG
jgi:putative addiction module component (TIGR02574 family)